MTAPTEAMPAGEVAMAAGSETIAAGAEPASSGIRSAKLICFENSGHALFYEEKDKFNAELVNFIEKKIITGKDFFPL
jgi:pimeloyl-ACP methyl ester carboxylesterase